MRAAILALLREGPRTGYQIMSDIEERSGGAWRPSPGAVYPALSQLADEGLIIGEESGGRRTFSLTDAGREYVEQNPDMARGAWESRPSRRPGSRPACSPRPPGWTAASCRWRTLARPSRSTPRNGCWSRPGASSTRSWPTTWPATGEDDRTQEKSTAMNDRFRISDADRERVTARLRDHFADGRLTRAELEERVTAALNAKTIGDLRRVMADLPEPGPDRGTLFPPRSSVFPPGAGAFPPEPGVFAPGPGVFGPGAGRFPGPACPRGRAARCGCAAAAGRGCCR